MEQTHLQHLARVAPQLPNEVQLTQLQSEKFLPKKGKSSSDKSNPIVEFLFGLLLIVAAFPIIWMNERRQVRTWKLINKAEKQCKEVKQTKLIDDALDQELVLIQGLVSAEGETIDKKIQSLKVRQCLKLKREVQIYAQRQVEERDQQDNVVHRTEYYWDTQSTNLASNHDQNDSFYPENAMLGAYTVSPHSIDLLSNYQTVQLDQSIINEILENIQNTFGSKKVAQDGNTLYVRMSHDSDIDQVGDFKLHWEYIPAEQTYTLLGQQMKVDDKNMTSIRQWNPARKDVPWGEDNGSPVDASESACCCSLICKCVEVCFKTIFQEVIHVMEPGNLSLDHLIKSMRTMNATTSTIFRVLTWFMLAIGNFLLFSPIIALLKWIPLVGWLLGGVAAFAAAVFAVIIGSILHLITLSVAWIFYRPLFGIALLAGVGILTFVMFQVGK